MLGWWKLRPYVAGLIVAALLLAAFWSIARRDNRETLIMIAAGTPAEGDTVTVFVGGAVAQPGVYTLPRGERVEGAITAAGGFSAEADPDGINRALRLRDEGQVIVPRKGQPTATAARVPATLAGASSAPPAAATGTRAPTATPLPAVIDINSAGVADLALLPGVGPKLAQEIVDYRNAHGPFKDAADLANVKGISERMVVGWGEMIRFGP